MGTPTVAVILYRFIIKQKCNWSFILFTNATLIYTQIILNICDKTLGIWGGRGEGDKKVQRVPIMKYIIHGDEKYRIGNMVNNCVVSLYGDRW